MTIIGGGEYRYELVQDWARPSGYGELQRTSGVATDSIDRVFVSQWGFPSMMIFDPSGNLVSNWKDSDISDPHGLNITDDTVHLTDRGHSICMTYDLDGNVLGQLGEKDQHSETGCEIMGELVPQAAGPFNFPTGLAPSPSGDLYVADGYRNCRVHRFTGRGRLISSWGQPGKHDQADFHLPHSILVDMDGVVYVCDRENSRIQLFSPDGEPIGMWTDVHRPTDIAMDKGGAFYVSELAIDNLPPRVSVFDQFGSLLSRWEARSAHGIWVDSRGDIYLTIRLANNVDKFVRI